MMTRYTPTLTRRCENPECRCFGQALIDRGYGYPVCPSMPLRSSVKTDARNKEMSTRYIRSYKTEEILEYDQELNVPKWLRV